MGSHQFTGSKVVALGRNTEGKEKKKRKHRERRGGEETEMSVLYRERLLGEGKSVP